MDTQDKEIFTINEENIEKLVQRLYIAYNNSEGLLQNQNDLVESQVPDGVKRGSKEHALFIFYVVQNDHGVKSHRMYEKAKELYIHSPEYFNPEWVREHYAKGDLNDLVENVSRKLGSRYPQALAKSWYENSVVLCDRYNGDPIRMFQSSNDAIELIKTMKSFRGYGPKIGGMLLRAVVGVGFNSSLKNLEKVLVPVDIHDSRILFFTGGFINPAHKTPGFDYYKYVEKAQRALLKACNKSAISWLNVDRALWLTGSHGCSENRCNECCLKDMCEKICTIKGEYVDK